MLEPERGGVEEEKKGRETEAPTNDWEVIHRNTPQRRYLVRFLGNRNQACDDDAKNRGAVLDASSLFKSFESSKRKLNARDASPGRFWQEPRNERAGIVERSAKKGN